MGVALVNDTFETPITELVEKVKAAAQLVEVHE
jgi:hypothetical protein